MPKNAGDVHTLGSTERYKVIAAGMGALILTVGLARFAYTPMLFVMQQEAGLSTLAGGWLATFNYLGYITGALVAASIGDIHRKYVLYRLGLVAAFLTTAAMGLTDNIYLWAVLRFVSGLSSVAGLLLASGLVLNWQIRNRQKPELGLHFAGMGLGVALSGIAVEMMAHRLSWNEQWIALGMVGLVFGVAGWFWMPPPDDPHLGQAGRTKRQSPGKAWFWLLVAVYFCAGFGYVVSATFIVAIVGKLPLFAGKANYVWIVIGLTAVPSCYVWDRVADRVGHIGALIFAFVAQIVSIVLPAISDGIFANLLGAILYGGTFVGIVSLTLFLVGQYLPENPAKAMARMTLSYGVAQITAPAIAGYIASHTGNYRDALLLAAGVTALGLLLLFRMLRLGHR